MSTINSEQLAKQWEAVYKAAGEAVDWVAAVRGNAPRLENEADHLTLRLRRARNMARRLGAVSERPMTVGFFGLSQAGKSYLISALAAGENGKLETNFGLQRLDFIDHVNPPGGGKEATGLVTRFSRTASPGPSDYPIELRLFSEMDVAKILANSFFKDFNHEKLQYEYNDQQINKLLAELTKRKQHQALAGVNEDDVVDLWDYMNDRFASSSKALAGYYWPQAVALLPYLVVEDRAQLLAVLWGNIQEFTDTYIQFSKVLKSLSHAETVFVPLEALVKTTPEGHLSQVDSIMNVDMLGRMAGTDEQKLFIRPEINKVLQPEVEVSVPLLAALTVEMVFPLVEKTKEPIFESVDLLDFPGYRGRKDHASAEDMRKSAEKAGIHPIAELFLRGKVAYLFERYTDSQEMNVLIVCTPSNKQSDVEDVGPVLTEWINRTQGESPEIRAKRQPGLLWAITMFDLRIGNQLDMSEALLPVAWNGMMKSAMLEKFGSFAWMQEWDHNQPFNNTFLVRKPGFKVSFLELEGNQELAIQSAMSTSLAAMRRTFSAEETVTTHFSAPEAAWDAMLSLNDGGMGRIAAYLQEVACSSLKLERLQEQMEALVHELVEARLSPWYMAEGAGEVTKKKKIAQQVLDDLKPRLQLFGEFLDRLMLPDHLLRSLYLRTTEEESLDYLDDGEIVEASADESGGAMALGGDLLGFDVEMDLMGDHESDEEASGVVRSSAVDRSDVLFIQTVIREWFNHLRSLTDQQTLMRFLGFPQRTVESVTDEMITAANRLGMENMLLDAIGRIGQDTTKRDILVERQMLTVKNVLGDFIAWLGFMDVTLSERPDSRLNKGAKLFQGPPSMSKGVLPDLSEKAFNFSAIYLYDWFVAFSHMAQANAGHSAGREITLEQNEKLGKIIAGFSLVD